MKARVWLYDGMSGWHFVTLPKTQAKAIRERFGVLKRGFGSLRVKVTIGKTEWKTSIFPDKTSHSYVLPIKADVRKKEGIVADKIISFNVQVLT